jgi:uncharacterized lipoprotein YmbA
VALLFAVGLAACGHSPPTHFFTLAPVRADPPDTHFAGAPVQVRAVHIPAMLDRQQLVSESGRDQVDVHQFDQWGGPLDEMMRRVLSEDLQARLPAGMVVAPKAPAPPGTRGLVIDVQEFEPAAGGKVVLDASWTLLGGTPGEATPGDAKADRSKTGSSKAGSSKSGGGLAGLFKSGGGSSTAESGNSGAGNAAEPTIREQRRFESASGSGVADQVDTMSQLLGQLADQIAASLRAAGA